jgi:hypothetical protein
MLFSYWLACCRFIIGSSLAVVVRSEPANASANRSPSHRSSSESLPFVDLRATSTTPVVQRDAHAVPTTRSRERRDRVFDRLRGGARCSEVPVAQGSSNPAAEVVVTLTLLGECQLPAASGS